MHIKEPLLLIGKSVAAASFLSHYLNGPLPYAWRNINVLSASLNKTLPSSSCVSVRSSVSVKLDFRTTPV